MLSKKIKILYPVLHYPPVIGGLEQWTKNIAERQPGDVAILIVTGRVRGEPNFEKKGNVAIFRTSLFELTDLSHSSLFYIAGAFPLIVFRSLLLSRNADLVHCHGFVSALMGYFLSIVTGKPFIGTEQSVIWSGAISKFASGIVYRRARLCIASSRAISEWFGEIGVKRIEIIPNGVDVEKFIPKDKCSQCGTYDIPHCNVGYHKSHIILSVGRLEKVKGHKYLLDAFADIVNVIGSDPRWPSGVRPRLVIVGDGSERKNLEMQAVKLGVKDSVRFIGAIGHDDLPHYYHRADVFVMPSLSEGFGIAAIEALASRIPVIATSVGSLKELVEDKKSGLLVLPGNAGALNRAIQFVFNNSGAAELLAREGAKRASGYSWDSAASRASSIYKIICSPRILLVTSVFPPNIGGPSYYAEKLLAEFKKGGYGTCVISGRHACSFRKVFSALGNFEICYTLSSSPKILLPVFLAAKLRGKKLSVRIGGDFLWERAVERGRTDAPLRLFYEEYGKSLREKIVFGLLGFLFRHCDFVIFTSNFLRDLYIRYYRLNGRRVHVIENPYPEIDKRERSFPEVPTLLCAGRLLKLKNINFLLHAFKEVKEVAKSRIKLKIMGYGPQTQALSNLIDDLGLKDDVSIGGALSRDVLIREIKKSWLVAVPSLSEVTPNLILESCAAGTPVIVTRENGLPPSFLANLMAFNPKDKKELVFTILFLLDREKWKDYQKIIMSLDTTRSFRDAARDHIKIFQKL